MILAIPDTAIRERMVALSASAYRELVENHPEYEKTELIAGVITQKMTKSPEHNYYSHRLFQELQRLSPAGTEILKEHSLSLGESEPEPDITVVPGSIADYFDRNPDSALLVVEIAKASLAYDRSKLAIYARAAIPRVWIVNLLNHTVEDYQEPGATTYARCDVVDATQTLTIWGQRLDLSQLFRD